MRENRRGHLGAIDRLMALAPKSSDGVTSVDASPVGRSPSGSRSTRGFPPLTKPVPVFALGVTVANARTIAAEIASFLHHYSDTVRSRDIAVTESGHSRPRLARAARFLFGTGGRS